MQRIVTLMYIGTSPVETPRGIMYASFLTVPIGKEFSIVVASLVLVPEAGVEPINLYEFEAVKNTLGRDDAYRLIGSCAAGTACQNKKAFLEEPCNYFTPVEGRQLYSGDMPFVYAHTFGVNGLLEPAVKTLTDEVLSDPQFGFITKRGARLDLLQAS